MKQRIQRLVGLVESSPAGAVPLGAYDQGENVSDYDERGGRVRLASRPGLLRFGRGTPCPSGSPVRHMITARRPLPKEVFRTLGTTALDDTTPSAISAKWTEDLEGEILDASTDDAGTVFLLTDAGSVYRIDKDQQIERIFTASAPALFELVPSIYADPFEGVIVAFSYDLSIDGGATRFQRWTFSEDTDSWVLAFDEAQDPRVERFWGRDGEILAVGRKPSNVDEGPDYVMALFGGVNTPAWSVRWTRSAPDPIVDVDFSAEALYGCVEPNAGRSDDRGGASVAWTPREMPNAAQRLYSGLSALREQSVRGLTDGSPVGIMRDARLDPSDFPDVLDTTKRNAGTYGEETNIPRLRDDPNGRGVEILLRPNDDGGSNEFGAKLSTNRHTSTRPKPSGAALAPWQRAHIPAMWPDSDASLAALWCHTTLLRLTIEEFPSATNWRIVFDHREYRIWMRGTTQIEVRLELPGTASAATHTFTGLTEAYLCSTLIIGQYGTASSTWRVNGVVKSSTLTVQARGYNYGTSFWGQVGYPYEVNPWLGGHFGLKESWVFLADSTGGPVHRDAIVTADVEKMEGFVCHAHECQDILDAAHPYDVAPPVSAGDPDPIYEVEAAFRSPDAFLFRVDRSTGRLRWIYGGETATPQGNVGRGVAAGPEGELYTAGGFFPGLPIQLSRLEDNGDSVTHLWTVTEIDGDGSDTAVGRMKPLPDRAGGVILPWRAAAAGPQVSKVARLLDDGTFDWEFALPDVRRLFLGGLFIDRSLTPNGAKQHEFLYALTDGSPATLRRIELVGRQATGATDPQEIQHIAFCDSGAISRLIGGEWTAEPGFTFAPGERPWSFEYFGLHFIGTPERYIVWEPAFKRFRDWTPKLGDAIPPRIVMAVRWGGKVLAVSEDDRHILLGSETANAFGWNTGADPETGAIEVTRAFAGTTASAGAVPDPMTALMPANDDTCFIGTTRSVWRVTGDPNNGGVLDDVLANEGVLDHWSWCRGDAGELYWLTTALRVVTFSGSGMGDLSTGAIEHRLQGLSPRTHRFELKWSTRRMGLWLVAIRRGGVDPNPLQLFWSKRTGGWHPVRFYGGAGRQVTSISSLEASDEEGWGVVFGAADGYLRMEHPEALDDDGVPIAWHVRLPMGGDADAFGAMLETVEVVASPRQGPVRVRGLAARTGEDEPATEIAGWAVAGRGDIVQVQVAGHLTWLELAGTEPAAIDSLVVDIHPWGVD
jgi:hypothetical protein